MGLGCFRALASGRGLLRVWITGCSELDSMSRLLSSLIPVARMVAIMAKPVRASLDMQPRLGFRVVVLNLSCSEDRRRFCCGEFGFSLRSTRWLNKALEHLHGH